MMLARALMPALLILVSLPSAHAIEGGSETSAGSAIATRVGAVYNVDASLLCTGVIVAPRAVLTAAHCATPEQKVKVIFRTVAHGKIPASASVPVAHFVPSPAWGERRAREADRGDIALAILDGPVPAGHVPASLVDLGAGASSATGLPDRKVIVVGYGGSSHRASAGWGHLRQVEVDARFWGWGETELFLQTARGSACEGDSGGPAFIEGSTGGLGVVAVISRSLLSYGQRLCFHRMGFTSLGPWRDWIDEQLAMHGSQPASWEQAAPAPPERAPEAGDGKTGLGG